MENTELFTRFGQCRCCLSFGNHRDIREEYYFNHIREVYNDILTECLNITLSTDKFLTTLICTKCVHRLRDAASFRTLVLNTEQQLLKEVSTKNDQDPVFVAVPGNASSTSIPEIKTELEFNTDTEVNAFDEGDFEVNTAEIKQEYEVPSDASPTSTHEIKIEFDSNTDTEADALVEYGMDGHYLEEGSKVDVLKREHSKHFDEGDLEVNTAEIKQEYQGGEGELEEVVQEGLVHRQARIACFPALILLPTDSLLRERLTMHPGHTGQLEGGATVAKMPKTNAELCREYRKRKKEANQIKNNTEPKPKNLKKINNAKTCRLYRLRKKMLAQGQQITSDQVLCPPSTPSLPMTSGSSPLLVTTDSTSSIATPNHNCRNVEAEVHEKDSPVQYHHSTSSKNDPVVIIKRHLNVRPRLQNEV